MRKYALERPAIPPPRTAMRCGSPAEVDEDRWWWQLAATQGNGEDAESNCDRRSARAAMVVCNIEGACLWSRMAGYSDFVLEQTGRDCEGDVLT